MKFKTFIKNLIDDDILGVTAQTTFHLLFAIFPFLLFMLSVLHRFMLDLPRETLSFVLPSAITSFLTESPASTTTNYLTLALGLWSSSNAIWALMKGIHRSYIGKRLRPSIKARGLALLFSAGFVLALAIPLALWVFTLPHKLASGWQDGLRFLGSAAVIYIFTVFLYTVTPGLWQFKRTAPIGAAVATGLWLLLNYIFERISPLLYGSITLESGINALLGIAAWQFIISFGILLGAEINAALQPTRE